MAIPPRVVRDLLTSTAPPAAAQPPAAAPAAPAQPVGQGQTSNSGFGQQWNFGPFKVRPMNDAQSGAIGALFGNDFLGKLQAFIQSLQSGQQATFPVQFPAQNSERRAPNPAAPPQGVPPAALQQLLGSPQAQEWRAKFPFLSQPPTAP